MSRMIIYLGIITAVIYNQAHDLRFFGRLEQRSADVDAPCQVLRGPKANAASAWEAT